MDTERKHKIYLNELLLRRIVYAITKAITEDVPREVRNNRLETNNRHKFASGDWINDNLRKHVVNENVMLIPFMRFAYEGRILVDHENKITYTVATLANLAAVAQKFGSKPHYLRTILFAENGDCEGKSKQMTLSDYAADIGIESFTEEEFLDDYYDIMKGLINVADGYRHYVVGYKAEKWEIKDIRLLFLDKDFAEIDSCSLMDYIIPDFASLTSNEVESDEETANNKDENSRHRLFKIRPGVKPILPELEDEI